MTYLVCDARRFADLCRMDVATDDVQTAKAEAEKLARQYGCRTYVLAIVGEVEGQVHPRWVQDPAPPAAQEAASYGAPPVVGWYGITMP